MVLPLVVSLNKLVNCTLKINGRGNCDGLSCIFSFCVPCTGCLMTVVLYTNRSSHAFSRLGTTIDTLNDRFGAVFKNSATTTPKETQIFARII